MKKRILRIALIASIISFVAGACLFGIIALADTLLNPDSGTFTVQFNPSGTHVEDDILKVRLDFYPAEGCKTYQQQHISVPVFPNPNDPFEGYKGEVITDPDGTKYPSDPAQYNAWVDSLPHIWRLNPAICVFVAVDENITKALLTQFIQGIYTADVLATLDDALVQPDSAHLVSPYMRNKTQLSTTKTTTFDDALRDEINQRLSGLVIEGQGGGTIQLIQRGSIDVGVAATDRASYIELYLAPTSYTRWAVANPANADGTITTVEIFLDYESGVTATWAGTGYITSGTTIQTRDSELLGDVPADSKQTIAGLTISVVTGDYIGACGKAAGSYSYIEIDTSGGNGYYHKNQELIDPGDSGIYTLAPTSTMSLYGTGTESVGETFIPRVEIW